MNLIRDSANDLQITQAEGASGPLYYTAHLRYYLDAQTIQARDRGIVVDRRFELASTQVNQAAVGDVISVTTTIIAPTNLYQMLVEVPIPAGTEPIDISLATTSTQFDGPKFDAVENVGMLQKPWRSWIPTATDIRDEKVALFTTYLPAGTYEYTFQVRATMPGEYGVLPAYAEQMYFNEVWGRSASQVFTVAEGGRK